MLFWANDSPKFHALKNTRKLTETPQRLRPSVFSVRIHGPPVPHSLSPKFNMSIPEIIEHLKLSGTVQVCCAIPGPHLKPFVRAPCMRTDHLSEGKGHRMSQWDSENPVGSSDNKHSLYRIATDSCYSCYRLKAFRLCRVQSLEVFPQYLKIKSESKWMKKIGAHRSGMVVGLAWLSCNLIFELHPSKGPCAISEVQIREQWSFCIRICFPFNDWIQALRSHTSSTIQRCATQVSMTQVDNSSPDTGMLACVSVLLLDPNECWRCFVPVAWHLVCCLHPNFP